MPRGFSLALGKVESCVFWGNTTRLTTSMEEERRWRKATKEHQELP